MRTDVFIQRESELLEDLIRTSSSNYENVIINCPNDESGKDKSLIETIKKFVRIESEISVEILTQLLLNYNTDEKPLFVKLDCPSDDKSSSEFVDRVRKFLTQRLNFITNTLAHFDYNRHTLANVVCFHLEASLNIVAPEKEKLISFSQVGVNDAINKNVMNKENYFVQDREQRSKLSDYFFEHSDIIVPAIKSFGRLIYIMSEWLQRSDWLPFIEKIDDKKLTELMENKTDLLVALERQTVLPGETDCSMRAILFCLVEAYQRQRRSGSEYRSGSSSFLANIIYIPNKTEKVTASNQFQQFLACNEPLNKLEHYFMSKEREEYYTPLMQGEGLGEITALALKIGSDFKNCRAIMSQFLQQNGNLKHAIILKDKAGLLSLLNIRAPEIWAITLMNVGSDNLINILLQKKDLTSVLKVEVEKLKNDIVLLQKNDPATLNAEDEKIKNAVVLLYVYIEVYKRLRQQGDTHKSSFSWMAQMGGYKVYTKEEKLAAANELQKYLIQETLSYDDFFKGSQLVGALAEGELKIVNDFVKEMKQSLAQKFKLGKG